MGVVGLGVVGVALRTFRFVSCEVAGRAGLQGTGHAFPSWIVTFFRLEPSLPAEETRQKYAQGHGQNRMPEGIGYRPWRSAPLSEQAGGGYPSNKRTSGRSQRARGNHDPVRLGTSETRYCLVGP
jgi:hypothetical protein